MADERIRFCQRCSMVARLNDGQPPNPCRGCGGTNFDFSPRRHAAGRFYALADWHRPDASGVMSDADFLRVQGIDPEDGF